MIEVDKNRIARVTRTLDMVSVVNMLWSVLISDVLSKFQAAIQLRASDVQLIQISDTCVLHIFFCSRLGLF